jgi:hypothetical protein
MAEYPDDVFEGALADGVVVCQLKPEMKHHLRQPPFKEDSNAYLEEGLLSFTQ